MKQNMGLADRLLRLLIAVTLAFVYLSGTVTGGWQIFLAVVMCILAVTAVLGFCPLYSLLGLNTSEGSKNKKEGA